ncbi:MAG: hypothetical protein K9L30_07725 [Desulfobacterales bacterium]|nr:hypothetical protein [Desulfobacterales bacterium]
MRDVISLLKPRLWAFTKRGFTFHSGLKSIIFACVGLVFWAGIFMAGYRVLAYCSQAEDIGEILTGKILSMAIITFFSLLIFSALLTTLSKLYLSRDLNLVHALPVSADKIFLSRWIESTADSSWMVIIYSIPIFIAYGMVYKTGIFYYMAIILTIIPLCIVASSISALVIQLAVIILPANRIRSIFVFLGLIAFIFLYVSFRMLKPERLVDPEAFSTVLIYVQQLSTPNSPLLPSTWAYDGLTAARLGNIRTALFHITLSISSAIFFILVNLQIAKLIYFKGFSKAQSAMIRLFRSNGIILEKLFFFLKPPVRAFVIKEFKTFWRDQTQWSQIFLIGALIIIYVYNFSVLPLEKSPIGTFYLQNLFSFLNMGLAAFVLTAITARFAYPSISTEGGAFWIVRSSPVSIRSFLWIKFFIYLFPLLILSEILIIATNLMLHVTPFMMWLSVITILFMTPGVVALGIGLGAAYPDFNAESPVQSVTGFGGLLFMVISAGFIGVIIILEAGPVYTVFMSDIRNFQISNLHWAWVFGSFFTAFIICILAMVVPMRIGSQILGNIK